MQSFRFLHAADLHLDSPFRGVADLPEPVRRHIRESTFQALRNLVRIAVQEEVRFVLVSGDVYDLADRSLRAQLRFGQAAEELARHGIALYVVHGNHDPLEGGRALFDWPPNVHIFGSDAVETVYHRDEAGRTIAAISGISYAKAAVTDNLAQRFPAPDPDVYSIAMLHANVDGDSGHDNYAPCSKDELIRAGYDYWALGHIHSRRVVQESPWIVYPGNIQGRSVRETGSKGVYVAEVSPAGGTKLTFHATEAVRWERRTVSIEALVSGQDLKDRLERELQTVAEECGGIPAIVRLTLSGRGPLHRMLQQGTELQELVAELQGEAARLAESGDPFVWIESCRAETGAPIPFERLMEQESFVGDLLRLSESLLADEEALRAFCGEALAPLAGNVRAGKYIRPFDTADLRRWLTAARELAADELAAGEHMADELAAEGGQAAGAPLTGPFAGGGFGNGRSAKGGPDGTAGWAK